MQNSLPSLLGSADLYVSYDSEPHGSLNICNTISVPTFKMEEEEGSGAARSRCWILIKPPC